MMAMPATVLRTSRYCRIAWPERRGGGAEQHEDGGEARHEQEGRQHRPLADGAVVARAETVEGRAGEKGQIGRHQRQNAGAQEADEAAERRGGKGNTEHGKPSSSLPGSGRKPVKGRVLQLVKGADFRFAGRMNQLRNLITDVAGLRVGNADDAALGSGVTVALFDEPAVVSSSPCWRSAGTRETDLLDPDKMVPGHPRRRAVRRLRLRARCGERRAGLPARTGHRLCRQGCRSSLWSRRRPASTSSMAATRTGAATRPIASSAMRRPGMPAWTSRSAPPAADTAPPRRT